LIRRFRMVVVGPCVKQYSHWVVVHTKVVEIVLAARALCPPAELVGALLPAEMPLSVVRAKNTNTDSARRRGNRQSPAAGAAHAPRRPQRPSPPVQLPLFADTASLVRVWPELNEWRHYRMEVWPDLFGRALLVRQCGRIGTKRYRRLDPHPDPGAERPRNPCF
jgi:hypothetical protein